MNKKQQYIQKKIEKNHAKAIALLNENVDLQDKKNLAGKYTESYVTFGRGKNKKTQLIGRRHWTEDFVDEDTGDVVSIERSEICRVDGVPTSQFGTPLTRYK